MKVKKIQASPIIRKDAADELADMRENLESKNKTAAKWAKIKSVIQVLAISQSAMTFIYGVVGMILKTDWTLWGVFTFQMFTSLGLWFTDLIAEKRSTEHYEELTCEQHFVDLISNFELQGLFIRNINEEDKVCLVDAEVFDTKNKKNYTNTLGFFDVQFVGGIDTPAVNFASEIAYIPADIPTK